MPSKKQVTPFEEITYLIYRIRGVNVMLDTDLAHLYEVTTKRLNEQVKRNIERFPEDFAFQLTANEHDSLRSQFAILKTNPGRGRHRKYPPYVFTEQGVAMLSGVIHSPQAIQANIAIMRAFVQMKGLINSNQALSRKITALEKKYDEQFKVVFDAIRKLMIPPEKQKRSIGFIGSEDKKKR